MNRYTEPDYKSAALITIDIQSDTLDGQPLEVPGTSAILPKMCILLGEARRARLHIIHIVRIYKRDGSNVDLCRRGFVEEGNAILAKDSPGCELADELRPSSETKLNFDFLLDGGIQELQPKEMVIYKPRWGAFYETPLHDYLKKQNISTLIFTGCNFPNCPRTSIYEASERDFRVVLVTDAVSGLYQQGIKEMKNIGVTLLTTQELVNELRKLN
ncbi:MAG: cysteine hydrolase [Bacteroidota bacterium]|nr:cysteine hydrolase [Bacteroidota bacterium]